MKAKTQPAEKVKVGTINLVDVDPRAHLPEDNLSPYEGTKKIKIGKCPLEITFLGVNLDPELEAEIMLVLKHNVDLLAWKPSDMPKIDLNIMVRHLSLSEKEAGVSKETKKRRGVKESK